MPAIDDLPVADRSPGSSKLAVIAALDVERGCLDAQSSGYVILQSGPGPERAALAARSAVSQGAAALMSWGLAGALDAGVGPGTVIVPARVVDDAGSQISTAAAWREALTGELSSAFEVSGDTLLSVAEVLESPSAKTRAGARFGAVACDMESAAIAGVADESGLPFVALRVIADSATDRLPQRIGLWVDGRGNRRVSPVLTALADPSQWHPLWLIAMRFRRARAALAGISRQLSSRSFLCDSALTKAA